MRLSSKEIKVIANAFSELILNMDVELYLFGSRTDGAKKGGDIYLLVVVSKNNKNSVVDLQTKIRSKIFEIFPEQKIDITVTTKNSLQTDPFLKSIYPDCILLK